MNEKVGRNIESFMLRAKLIGIEARLSDENDKLVITYSSKNHSYGIYDARANNYSGEIFSAINYNKYFFWGYKKDSKTSELYLIGSKIKQFRNVKLVNVYITSDCPVIIIWIPTTKKCYLLNKDGKHVGYGTSNNLPRLAVIDKDLYLVNGLHIFNNRLEKIDDSWLMDD